MGTPATSQSYSESSPRFKAVIKLMKQLGVEGGLFEAVPKDQLVTFMLPIYETSLRILAWVHERTVCYPVLSPFCVDERRNVLQQKDCMKDLNERALEYSKEHGTKPVVLDKSAISRGFAHWKIRGLVRFDDEQGRFYPCGKVTPTPEAYSSSDEDSISPDLRELLKQFPADEPTVIVQGLLERQARLKKAIADAVRPVRQLHRQADLDFLAEHGIAKPAGSKKYARLHVHAPPPTENHKLTDEELRVRATGQPENGSSELRVHATQPEISTEDQPPAPTAQAPAGSTDELHVHATPETPTAEPAHQPPPAVPTFEEWKQLYPKDHLDEQKSDQIFNTLSQADKIKATDGLLTHLGCERWLHAPNYIPLASNFLKRREYNYSPPPLLRLNLKNGNSVPIQSRSRGSSHGISVDQVRNYLTANARAVGSAGFREIAETLESLAADVKDDSDLEKLERQLNKLEDEMLDALKGAQTAQHLAEAGRSLNDALKPYQGKMTAEQIEMLGRQHLERHVLNEAGVPRLSLFYMP
jgi:hypothetical protein